MAAGETILIYGPMTFFNVLTRHINQEIMYDDSGTDAIGFRFIYSCMGHIHGLPAALTGVLPTTGDGNAGNALVQLRYLLQPRQHVEMRMGVTVDSFGNIINAGTAVLYCDPANQQGSTNVNFKDINNGPKCHVLNVTRVASDSLLRVDLEVEICQLICNPDGSTGNATGILNHRWTVVDDIDGDFFTSRTFTGKLRLSSSQVNGNNFRYLCVPPLLQGMRRTSMQFAVAEDGLSLMYSLTDKEIAFAPPAPATTWAASFTQRGDYQNSLGHFYDAAITLGGDRNCDLKKLIAIASSMALAKFSNGVKLANDESYRVISIEVTEEYGDEKAAVHLRATAQKIDTNAEGLLSLNTKFLGVPITGNKIADVAPDYDYRFSRGARAGENIEVNGPISLVGAFSSFLQSGCGINFGINNGIVAQVNPPPVPFGGTSVSAVTTTSIPDDGSITTVYGPNNDRGFYTYYNVQHETEVDSGRANMPVGNPNTPSPFGGGSLDKPSDPGAQGATSVIVDVGPPQTRGKTTIDAERIGLPPVMPKPKDAGTIRISKYEDTTLAAGVTCDGKKTFRKMRRIWWWQSDYQLWIEDLMAGVGMDPSTWHAPLWLDIPVTDVSGPAPPISTPAYKPGF